MFAKSLVAYPPYTPLLFRTHCCITQKVIPRTSSGVSDTECVCATPGPASVSKILQESRLLSTLGVLEKIADDYD